MTNYKDSLNLLPCPFCGNDGKLTDRMGWGAPRWRAGCSKCWCDAWPGNTEEEAAANWNTRHNGTPDREGLIEMLNALKPGNIDDSFTRGFEQCRKKAIAAMGDASTREDEALSSGTVPTSPANTSEIPDTIMNWIEKHLYMKEHMDAAFMMSHADVYKFAELCLRKPEPVSVSLEKCATALLQYELDNPDCGCMFGEKAKVVLQAAGVLHDS